jgi:hypothetical protein
MRSAVLHFESATGNTYVISTDTDGAFSISLPPSAYRIWVTSEPATVSQVQIAPAEGPSVIPIRGGEHVTTSLLFLQRCRICQ